MLCMGEALVRRFQFAKELVIHWPLGGLGDMCPRRSWGYKYGKSHKGQSTSHRSPVDSQHKGQWRGALMFSLICAWTNGWANNRDADDLRRNHAHCNADPVFHLTHGATEGEFDGEWNPHPDLICCMLDTRLLCDSMTPLGSPVVPLEKGSVPMSLW